MIVINLHVSTWQVESELGTPRSTSSSQFQVSTISLLPCDSYTLSENNMIRRIEFCRWS